jgi:DNA ligase-1
VESVEVQVVVFAFDLLYLNGRPLMQETLRERRSLLATSFHEVPGMFYFACYRDTNNVDDIQAFLEEALQHGCEGLMVKTLDVEATYEPSKRSRHWLKIKKDYLKGIGDSVDLVPIGGYLGKGKRTGVYGGYLFACWNPDSEELQAVCKIGTGFSEEELERQAAYFKDHLISEPRAYYRVGENVKPDVWFDATQVTHFKICLVVGVGSQSSRLFPKSSLSSRMEYGRGR